MRSFLLTGLVAAFFWQAPASAADLVVAMPNWPSGQASANIIKAAIVERFGLEVDVREMGTLITFAAMDAGEVDIQPEVWRPNLDNLVRKYVTELGSVTLSPKTVAAWQGLCETRAAETLGIRSVFDLMDPAKIAAFDTNGDGKGELWIGAPLWSSTGIERIRANSYGYARQFDLIEAEEDVAMAAVDIAVATDQPLVFACYSPHHIFKLHDIVRLEEAPHDPSKWNIVLPNQDPLWVKNSSAPVAWPAVHYQVAYATRLKTERPEIVNFLNAVDFTPEDVEAMTYALQVDRIDPEVYARDWVASNADRVKGWAGK